MFDLHKARSLRFVSQRFLDPGFIVSAIAKSCIEHLRNCQTLDQLKQIQTQIFVAGLHQNPDANSHLIAFCADRSTGNSGYAEKIFDHIENPSLFVYNLMIRSRAKTDCFERVVSLFPRLRAEGLRPDKYTYPFVVKALARLGRVCEARNVHGLVVKTGFELNTYVCHSLISFYGCLGEFASAQKLFDQIPDRNPVSWNVLICAYVRRGRFEEAVGVFHRMREECEEEPNESTFVSTISACTALRDLALGEDILRRFTDDLSFTVNMRNALLDMYVKCGHLSAAQKFFNEIPEKDVTNVTSMVTGYVKSGKLDKAKELFYKYLVSDVVLWTALINGYVRSGRVNEAMLLFGVMQSRRIEPDKVTMICLLWGCAQFGELEKGEWLHGCIERQGIEIDAILGTALIDMYAKCGQIEKSSEVFGALGEKSTSAWTSIICGLARNSQGKRALELFEEMQRAGARPDELTFTGVLNACSNAGLVEEGCRYFCSMTEIYKVHPNLEHLKCLVHLFGRAGFLNEAQELVETLANGNNAIEEPLYRAILRDCGVNGNFELGERLARRLEGVKLPDSDVQRLLSKVYNSAGRCEVMRASEVKRKIRHGRKSQCP